jgi:hypothetical protein
MDNTTPDSKKCRECGESKPLSAFGKRKQSPDGLQLYCRPCIGLRNGAAYRKRQAAEGKTPREFRSHSSVPAGHKYCANCKETKLLSQFGSNRANKSGLADYCKPCHNTVTAEIRAKNHGSVRSYHLKRRYGLSAEEVAELIRRQGGMCLVCTRAPAVHVDHDHETGQFRGVLCFSCNGALGQFEDECERLQLAADYLEGTLWYVDLIRTELAESGTPKLLPRLEHGQRSSREYKLRGKYGVSEPYVDLMSVLQRGLCLVCMDRPHTHIDHDHVSGEIRGLLCSGCNTGMGQFKDDPVVIKRAVDYLRGMSSLVEAVR